MPTFPVHDAKARLSELIALAERGDEVVIARGSVPAVRLVPVVAAGSWDKRWSKASSCLALTPTR